MPNSDHDEVRMPGGDFAIEAAVELAFTALLREARRRGMDLAPVMGLMYLPEPAVTQQFQDACRAVIDLLTVC